jgi:hypothetical protein
MVTPLSRLSNEEEPDRQLCRLMLWEIDAARSLPAEAGSHADSWVKAPPILTGGFRL